MAEDAEEVVAVAGTLGGDAVAEILLKHAPTLEPAVPSAASHVGADDRLPTDDGVDEGTIDAVGRRTHVLTDEDLGCDIQRQLLGGVVEAELLAGNWTPGRDDAPDRVVDLLQVRHQALVLEGLLHDPPMVAMLLEVHQHDPALEERPDEVAPARGVRECAVAVAEDGL